jgi:hypothetical protein
MRFRGLATLRWPRLVEDVPPIHSPAELYARARRMGWAEPEARNLQAYFLGLKIADENRPLRPWTRRQIAVCEWLRWLYAETGGLR